MSREIGIIVQLDSIEELFVAPAANPFSTHAVDVLGQTGLTIVQMRVMQFRPRLPRQVHLTVQLPSEQILPDLAQRTRAAVQRHCAKKIDNNRVQRQVAARRLRFLQIARPPLAAGTERHNGVRSRRTLPPGGSVSPGAPAAGLMPGRPDQRSRQEL